jgi:aryl carrier-like protein
MTLQQWRSTLRPKVQGSLNLHKVLSKDLDFFVMLSSLSGIIGASGLSNYAFGCAYQDALARYKIGIGQAAISIDLGIVDGVGYTAEHQGASSLMRSLGMQYISEEYLHALLRYYCDTDIKIQSTSEAQVVVGFMTEKRLRERGLVQPRSYTRSLMSHLRHFTPSVAQHQDLDKSPKKLPATPASQENPATEDKHRSQAAVSKAICGRLANILDLSINDISPAQALHTYGVDSLVAMEIRNWFKASMGTDVAVLDILSNISIDSLASRVA